MSALEPKAREAWLARFEKAAIQIPEPRLSALRQEILADFERADDPGDLERYPLPEEIVAEELAAAGGVTVDRREPLRRRTLATGAIVIVVVAVLLAVVLPLALAIGH
jgi:hypothetical protein